MKIHVTFYKPSGKYYSGGSVEIGDIKLWDQKFKQTIVNNQNILSDGWQGSFYVLVEDDKELFSNPYYVDFYNFLFKPDEFLHIKKQNHI